MLWGASSKRTRCVSGPSKCVLSLPKHRFLPAPMAKQNWTNERLRFGSVPKLWACILCVGLNALIQIKSMSAVISSEYEVKDKENKHDAIIKRLSASFSWKSHRRECTHAIVTVVGNGCLRIIRYFCDRHCSKNTSFRGTYHYSFYDDGDRHNAHVLWNFFDCDVLAIKFVGLFRYIGTCWLVDMACSNIDARFLHVKRRQIYICINRQLLWSFVLLQKCDKIL